MMPSGIVSLPVCASDKLLYIERPLLRCLSARSSRGKGRDRLCTNFRLWQLQGVHEALSRTLLKAQWRDDQFLTTRTI